jgi:hypothetical protein
MLNTGWARQGDFIANQEARLTAAFISDQVKDDAVG